MNDSFFSHRPRRPVPRRLAGAALVALLVVSACGDDDGVAPPGAVAAPTPTATPAPTPDATARIMAGGDTTVFETSIHAYAQPARNLPLDRRSDFFVGNALFNRTWVTAPSSTEGSDGVGPLFNARSCSTCHFRDGRGRPPLDSSELAVALLFRLSVPGTASTGGPQPEPRYGGQFQGQAILGVPAEGRVTIDIEEISGTYGDGEPYTLARPTYVFDELAYGPLAADFQTSPRVAPFLIGLGLLAAVDEEAVRGLADPDDVDGDGISGRVNVVWDVQDTAPRLGRFGWKANQPTLAQQNAGAFNGDMGLSSPLFPEQSCTAVQAACLASPDGGSPEVDRDKLDFVTFYTHLLAVPARRDVDDPTVLRGETLFREAGCDACHLPTVVTGDLPGFPEVSRQTIQPFTDLLLHDLGPDLSDERPDFLASGTEWRTAPLWGIGLVSTVNRHTRFLHDGRARDLAEAILWHGGEGEASREAFRTLPAADRAALIRFLESL